MDTLRLLHGIEALLDEPGNLSGADVPRFYFPSPDTEEIMSTASPSLEGFRMFEDQVPTLEVTQAVKADPMPIQHLADQQTLPLLVQCNHMPTSSVSAAAGGDFTRRGRSGSSASATTGSSTDSDSVSVPVMRRPRRATRLTKKERDAFAAQNSTEYQSSEGSNHGEDEEKEKVDLSHMTEAEKQEWHRAQKRAKNKQSAALSRARKKAYMKNMQERIDSLELKTRGLREENQRLREENEWLVMENAALRAGQGQGQGQVPMGSGATAGVGSPSQGFQPSARTTAIFLVILLSVGLFISAGPGMPGTLGPRIPFYDSVSQAQTQQRMVMAATDSGAGYRRLMSTGGMANATAEHEGESGMDVETDNEYVSDNDDSDSEVAAIPSVSASTSSFSSSSSSPITVLPQHKKMIDHERARERPAVPDTDTGVPSTSTSASDDLIGRGAFKCPVPNQYLFCQDAIRFFHPEAEPEAKKTATTTAVSTHVNTGNLSDLLGLIVPYASFVGYSGSGSGNTTGTSTQADDHYIRFTCRILESRLVKGGSASV